MIHQVLGIGRWAVDFLFAVDRYDKEGVLGCLYDAGAPSSILRKAERLMDEAEYNSGLTYTNERLKRGVVLIGPTTSGDEFLDSFTHELRHLVDYIAPSAGVALDSEDAAYLSGDTARTLFEVVCALGCNSAQADSLPSAGRR